MLIKLIKTAATYQAAIADTQLGAPNDYEEEIAGGVAIARAAVGAYRIMTGHSRPDAVCNLLNDLMHLCDRDPRYQDFENNLNWAAGWYERPR
jgi:hypothetical protein